MRKIVTVELFRLKFEFKRVEIYVLRESFSIIIQDILFWHKIFKTVKSEAPFVACLSSPKSYRE